MVAKPDSLGNLLDHIVASDAFWQQQVSQDLIRRSMALELAVQKGLITRQQIVSLLVEVEQLAQKHHGSLADANNELVAAARKSALAASSPA